MSALRHLELLLETQTELSSFYKLEFLLIWVLHQLELLQPLRQLNQPQEHQLLRMIMVMRQDCQLQEMVEQETHLPLLQIIRISLKLDKELFLTQLSTTSS